jgi:type III secretion system YscQ/HrcQ family protein
LASLQPGDGLRLPVSLGANAPTPFTLKVGDNVAQLTPGPSGFQLATALQPQTQGGSDMDQPTDISTPDTTAETETQVTENAPVVEEAPTAPDTDTLPIQLSFKAADTSIRLGELGTLGAGALIPIQGGPDTTLEILANGRKIGSGELVAIGNTRAVRILTIE